MRLFSCSQIGPVLLNGRERKVLGESRQTDTVKLGSLAVVELLIIVCPDYVYLFKLFLVLWKHFLPQDIKHRNVDVLSARLILPLLWLQVYGGDTQPDKQEDRGRHVGSTRSHREWRSWHSYGVSWMVPRTNWHLFYDQSDVFQVKLMDWERKRWMLKRQINLQLHSECLLFLIQTVVN